MASPKRLPNLLRRHVTNPNDESEYSGDDSTGDPKQDDPQPRQLILVRAGSHEQRARDCNGSPNQEGNRENDPTRWCELQHVAQS